MGLDRFFRPQILTVQFVHLLVDRINENGTRIHAHSNQIPIETSVKTNGFVSVQNERHVAPSLDGRRQVPPGGLAINSSISKLIH